MKKILIVVLSIIANVALMNAQEVILKQGKKVQNVEKGTYYKTDPSLMNKYIGTWVYEVNGEQFKFIISKKKTAVGGVFIDRLVAEYHLEKITDVYNDPDVYECHAKEYGLEVLATGKLRFRFWDYTYQKYGSLYFELIGENQAQWKLKETYNAFTDQKGFTVPTEMVLTKLKE
ncbi:DUF6705 family protein [Psychroflexus planctonicus]|uniref:DUF6705 domain-containing protein n=1 Tax=Psychroflexus planctonicus TaxID=1526575 RepID=A0ABQ1SMI8_9FLAO|nr:DUF6705 family protein [Psychroflexus planctonicus]GGE44163.1 hypothetical protein GCM10010832_25230 [Psychroflexus planctonicus]